LSHSSATSRTKSTDPGKGKRKTGQTDRRIFCPMTRTVAVLAIAAMSLRGQDATDPLPASARDVTARVLDLGPKAPHVICYVEFKATVRNDRQTEVRIGSEPVHFAGSDLRIEREWGGVWTRNLSGVLWYYTRIPKYDQCSVVPPGGTYELPKVDATVHVMKVDGRIPPSATVRFHLVAQCMDGKTIRSESILTEAIHVDTSATPEKYIEPTAAPEK